MAETFLGDTLLPLLDCGGQREKHLEILVDMVPCFTIIDQLGEVNSDCKELKDLIGQSSLQIKRNSKNTCL